MRSLLLGVLHRHVVHDIIHHHDDESSTTVPGHAGPQVFRHEAH
jgi:hypothetical protein